MSFKTLASILVLALLILNTSCQDDPAVIDLDLDMVKESIGSLPLDVVYAPDNPYSEEKQELGRLLFWDPILSGSEEVSCASCHHPDFGYGDGLERSIGVGGKGLGPNRRPGQLVARNAPTIVNTAFNGIDVERVYDQRTAPMFWDNRNLSLEEQAIQPILSAVEMRGTQISETAILDTVIQRLSAIPEYRVLFEAAFGTTAITEQRIGQAIATFERGITAPDTRVDQFLRGDESTLNEEEKMGIQRFIEVGCADCHKGPMLSDYQLHVIGVAQNGITDLGANDRHEFRTPTLRNLSSTGPYMHNGLIPTLREAVAFYEELPEAEGEFFNEVLSQNDLDREIRDLDMEEDDISSIVAFLEALNDDNFDRTIPVVVPSGLPVGGSIQ